MKWERRMTRKVKELAQKLNYRPNPFAQSLRKEAPRIIGVIVPNLVTHYYASVLDGIEEYASLNGYSVISANSHENHEIEKKAIDNFISMHVEGIIACLAQDTVDYSHFEEIHEMGLPWFFLHVHVWQISSLKWLPMEMKPHTKLLNISLNRVVGELPLSVAPIISIWFDVENMVI